MQLGDILSSAIGGYQGMQQPQNANSNASNIGNSLGNGAMDLANLIRKRMAMKPQNQDAPAQAPGFGGGYGGWDPNGMANA